MAAAVLGSCLNQILGTVEAKDALNPGRVADDRQSLVVCVAPPTQQDHQAYEGRISEPDAIQDEANPVRRNACLGKVPP